MRSREVQRLGARWRRGPGAEPGHRQVANLRRHARQPRAGQECEGRQPVLVGGLDAVRVQGLDDSLGDDADLGARFIERDQMRQVAEGVQVLDAPPRRGEHPANGALPGLGPRRQADHLHGGADGPRVR